MFALHYAICCFFTEKKEGKEVSYDKTALKLPLFYPFSVKSLM